MWKLEALSDSQLLRCLNTISPHVFYMMVGDALDTKKSLSVVRMADGEKLLMDLCDDSSEPISPTVQFPKDWLERFGVLDIPKNVLKSRLIRAANETDYFAPSLAGIQYPDYNVDHFSERGVYIDNFFPNSWDETMKINLFKKAGHVLMIHRNTHTADAMQIRAKYALGVKVTYIKLSNWKEADDVIEKAKKVDAPLVLYSAGAASKIIGPAIATSGNIPKVTLDIGQAMDRWTFTSLMDEAHRLRAEEAEKKYGVVAQLVEQRL